MKYNYLFLVIAVSSVSIVACKKSDTAKSKTTAEKIQAKWQVENLVSNDHINGIDHTVTYTGTVSENVDFRANGKMYSNVENTKDTLEYTLQNDSTITIAGSETYHIRNLGDHTVTLDEKMTTNSTDYSETMINLKK